VQPAQEKSAIIGAHVFQTISEGLNMIASLKRPS